MGKTWYALSVKQPWAALLVAGVKTVEIRTWPTTLRGRVLIHAGKKADDRSEGWALAEAANLLAAAEQLGGIIGTAELVACIAYRTAADFAADRPRHQNPPEWYHDARDASSTKKASRTYGFEFRNALAVPFLLCPGNTFFFKIEGVELS